jgi:hypothetical protein
MTLFLIGLMFLTGFSQTSLLEIPIDAASLTILKDENFKPIALMENKLVVEAQISGINALTNNGINYQLLLKPADLQYAQENQRFYLVTPPFHKKSEAAKDFLAMNGTILSEDDISYLYLTTLEFAERLPELKYEIAHVPFRKIILPELSVQNLQPSPSAPKATQSALINNIIAQITPTELAQFIRELSGEVPVTVWGRIDTIRTRYAVAADNSMGIWYCYDKLTTFSGLDSVKFNPFTWEYNRVDSNVIATKLGTTYPDQYYIIGGHIDCISERQYRDTLAPGADDNATGSVAMMIAAKYLNMIPFKYTIRFIAWNVEEFGLYGSEAHAMEARSRNDSILGVLNADMIGTETINRDSLSIYTGSRTSSRALGDTFNSVNSTYSIGLHIGRSTQMPSYSDHYPYYQQGYAANCIIEADFCPYYHTIQDRITANSFDTIFFTKVVKGMVATLATLAQPDTMYKDIGVREITQPIGTIDSGSIIVPQARVKNNGYITETFSVSFRIGDFYSETRNKTLAPGQNDTVNFPAWNAVQMGTHATKCTTQLAEDMNPANNFVNNSVTVQPLAVAENPTSQIPQTFALENTLPNPFLSRTFIRYALPKESQVQLQIYDITGTLIRTLKNDNEKPGFYQISWDGNDDNGNNVAKGIYFYRLEAGKDKAIRKTIKLD